MSTIRLEDGTRLKGDGPANRLKGDGPANRLEGDICGNPALQCGGKLYEHHPSGGRHLPEGRETKTISKLLL